MSKKIEKTLSHIPIIGKLAKFTKDYKPTWLNGLPFYDLLELYFSGIINGSLPYSASAIAFSFFMALFPFALFILNLIPYIPIEGFQQDFLNFVSQGVPPNTFNAIAIIINDILNNSHSGLLSSGFLLSIFLMANGLTSILSGFQTSKHIIFKRTYIHQYLIAVAMSLLLSIILLVTVATIVIFEIFIQNFKMKGMFVENIPFIELGRYIFIILMILVTTSVLFRFGTMHTHKPAFISIGSVFTTILVILSSYFFGIWVIQFSKYNQLYGSIGTLLVMMFYIWINCMILLLGFDLNASINKLRNK